MSGYDGSLKFDTQVSELGFNSGITKLGSIAKGGLKVVAASVAGIATAFGAVTKASLDSVASLEQNIGGVETLFKDSAQAVIDQANSAYKRAGVSANKYMETVTSFSASLLQGLGNNTAEAARIADMAMVDMSDNANKFGTNMEDIQNAYQGFAKQNYTMLDNLKLGYGGTQSEMVRLINDSGILNKKIEDLDNVSFDQMIQAIHKIQENMGIAGTTSQEALTTIEGSVGAAKAAFDNFLNGSGSPDALAESVITAGKNITDNLMQIVPRLAKELPKVGSLLMDSLSESLNSGKLNELMAVGGQIVSNLTAGTVQAIPGIIAASSQVIGSFAENISSAIPQLLSSGGEIISAIISGMAQVLPSIGVFGLEFVSELYNQLSAAAPGLLEKGYELLDNLVSGFVQAIPEALPKILDFIQGIGEQLAAAAPVMVQKGFELLSKLVEGIVTAIPILIARIPEIISTFANIINDNFPVILAKGAQLLGQLALGIVQAIPTLVMNIPKIIQAIVDVIQAFNWVNLGKTIITFFGNGIKSMVGFVKSAGTSIFNGIKSAIQNLPTLLRDIGRTAMTGLSNVIKTSVVAVKNAASSIVSGLVSTISSIPGKMLSIGKNIVRGLWNGISGMVGWITDKVMGFANSVLGGIKKALGIASPSKRMRDEVGKYMAIGMGIGFEKNIPVEDMEQGLRASVQALQKRSVEITSAPTGTSGNAWIDRGTVTRSNNEDVQNLMKAVKQLARYANRPVEAALVVDGKTMAKTIVKPMKKEMERIEKINNRLRGER